MNSNLSRKEKKLNLLEEEKIGNGLFILAAGLNIFGINVEQNEIQNNTSSVKSKSIYIVVLIIAFFVYKDIFRRDLIEYNDTLYNNEPIFSNTIKLIGNSFFVIGIILFVIAELTDNSSFPPEI